ncbi:7-deoxyloganetin glucosyltransferase-like [Punica granatum]|uniref:7-deoxyloganetin glucosyltransferase-like n=1 Tax=Punica granatum TaxID=22663 RepID=A0A6P8DAM1_PUNGR|nr:7-deoxyloganetin glucosyltransferase-like [Punica granatum]
MSSLGNKPHAVVVPYPGQGHVIPLLKLAKLLHHRGFHITFVNTEFNHRRLLNSRGPDSMKGLPSFRFETIPDGLPYSEANATQDVPSLCYSTQQNCLPYFRELLLKLNNMASSSEIPPVSCLVTDWAMMFTLEAADEIGVPKLNFWTASACGLLGYLHFKPLTEKGIVPFGDASFQTNGCLDTLLDWIPGSKVMRLKDMPSFIRTTDPEDVMLNWFIIEAERNEQATAIVINTFDELEHDALEALRTMLPPVYTIGPLQHHLDQVPDPELKSIGSNLWKEDRGCFEWLNTKAPNSVLLVNFGCVTVMSSEHMVEFAWGLANSNQTFLWVIRPDLILGESDMLPPGFVNATEGRGLIASWVPQEEVLKHPAVGAFLTHSGWNSTLESVSAGVTMICWPFFAEQHTNCRYCCTEWGPIGMEINSDVKRDEVEALVREMMEGEKGKEMRNKVMEWKKKAREATMAPSGSSYVNLEAVINKVLLVPRK